MKKKFPFIPTLEEALEERKRLWELTNATVKDKYNKVIVNVQGCGGYALDVTCTFDPEENTKQPYRIACLNYRQAKKLHKAMGEWLEQHEHLK
jgi:hypothetical protein